MCLMFAGVTGCTVDSDATLVFTNTTDETVWVAHMNRPGSVGGSFYLIPTPVGAVCWSA